MDPVMDKEWVMAETPNNKYLAGIYIKGAGLEFGVN